MGRRVGRGTAGDDLGPPNPAPPPSPLRTDDDPSTKPTRVGPTPWGAMMIFTNQNREDSRVACHPSLRSGSVWMGAQMLRCADPSLRSEPALSTAKG